jgi:threonine dehydrogenase-like Zn-dependent dehydrogenase
MAVSVWHRRRRVPPEFGTVLKGPSMRATLLYGVGDVRLVEVPDASLVEPTDAVVRVILSCICGSDLWPYKSTPAVERGIRMGHEFIGVIEDLGADVADLKRGDVVVAPFVWADNVCDFCTEGLHPSCRRGGMWGTRGVDGGQGEAVRVPYAQGTLVKLPVTEDSELMPSLLTLSDVYSTGHHAAVKAGVALGHTVTVIGDGAVGLCAVLAAKRLGAQRVVLMGRHPQRTEIGQEFGATDIVAERGEEGIEKVLELTRGDGTHAVLECVGTKESIQTAVRVVRPGGAISRMGIPQYDEGPLGFDTAMRNVTFTGGVAPARAYIDELMPDVLDGKIRPGRVFDRTIALDDVSDGYIAMADRTALKVLINV